MTSAARDGPETVAPIRVLSLTYAENRYANAQQVNAREILSRLDPREFRATLLSDGSGPCDVGLLPHVRLVRLPSHRRSLAILRLLLGGGFDLVFYPHPGLPEDVFLRLPRWAPGRNARVLVPVEGDLAQLDEVPGYLRRRATGLLRRADAVFPITQHVATTLFDRIGRLGEIVPVGVDVLRFAPRPAPRGPGPIHVLSVGTVKAWKRPEMAVLAARTYPSASFTWLGGGEGLDAVRRIAPPNLRFVGPVAHAGLSEEYRRADILLHPGRMEGLPKAILEAAASGLPVISFADHRPDYLRAHGAGYVVRDAVEMNAALHALLSDAGLRMRMGAAARAMAEGFDWNHVVTRWARIFSAEARRGRLGGGPARRQVPM